MITFAFTVDVDNDGMVLGSERNALTWDAVAEVPRIAEVFARRSIAATWFVRADNQLADVYGDAAWLLRGRESLWSNLRAAGHSIGWHPHIVRRAGDGTFAPETDDARCAIALRTLHHSLARAGWRFTSVRVGEAFHGNQSMRALDDVGLRVDSTALPGRRRIDGVRCFDWEPTPNRPYRPSGSDYRVAGVAPLSIVEVPMTTVPVEAPYDPRPLLRYLNLAYRQKVLRAAFALHLDALGAGDHVVVTILHPEEVRPRGEHPLYAFDLETVERNVDHLLDAAGARGEVRVASLETIAAEASLEVAA